MNKLEMSQILAKSKLLYGRDLSKDEVSAWFNFFGTSEPLDFKKAFETACKASKFFPTPGEVQAALDKQRLPPSLLMTPAEAFAQPKNTRMLLVIEARMFAAKAVPFTGGQFESPEALGTAERIHNIRVEKEFKQRFESLQNQAKAKVHLGMDPKEAIITVCPQASMCIKGPTGLKVARLVSGLCNPKVTALASGLCDTMGKKKEIK